MAAASVTAATITSPLALRAPRLWRCLRPIRATSAIEIHATIAPGPRCPPLVQPNRLFESLYWRSAAWHQPLSKVQPGEWLRYVSSMPSTTAIRWSCVLLGSIVAIRSAVEASVASLRRVVRKSSGSSQTSSFVACAGPSSDSVNDPFTESSQFRTTVIFIPSEVR